MTCEGSLSCTAGYQSPGWPVLFSVSYLGKHHVIYCETSSTIPRTWNKTKQLNRTLSNIPRNKTKQLNRNKLIKIMWKIQWLWFTVKIFTWNISASEYIFVNNVKYWKIFMMFVNTVKYCTRLANYVAILSRQYFLDFTIFYNVSHVSR